jgi:hypothetical protein
MNAAAAPTRQLRRVIMRTPFVADRPHPPFGDNHLAEVWQVGGGVGRPGSGCLHPI